MRLLKTIIRNFGLDDWIFTLTGLVAIVFSVLSFLGIVPFDEKQISAIVIGAIGILMTAFVTQAARHHVEISEIKNSLNPDTFEQKYSQINAFFNAIKQKDRFSEMALIYGLRAYGRLLSDKKISVERNHVLEFWRDCIGGSKRWLALNYVKPEETWDTAGWGGAISQGIQQERILAGGTIKRVFLVDNEKEYEHLKQTMKNQENIKIEVRWLTKDKLLMEKMTRERINALGTVDICIVDDSWVFLAYLDRARHLVRAEAINDKEITEQASLIFNEAFSKGEIP
jgi:hypothetical protein